MRSQTGDWLSVSVLAVIVMLKADGWKWTVFENPELWHWGCCFVVVVVLCFFFGGGGGGCCTGSQVSTTVWIFRKKLFQKIQIYTDSQGQYHCVVPRKKLFQKIIKFKLAVRVSICVLVPRKSSFKKFRFAVCMTRAIFHGRNMTPPTHTHTLTCR